MAKRMKARRKYLRRFGLLPDAEKGKKLRAKTEYGKRLEEKQKLKFLYGLTEKQFLCYVKNAKKMTENQDEAVLRQLETRLDNVIYRLGFAKTREQARQFVSHGHFRIGEKKINIPSYDVKVGETLIMNEELFLNPAVQENLKESKTEDLPSWLERKGNSASIQSVPRSEDLPKDIDMKTVLEFYR